MEISGSGEAAVVSKYDFTSFLDELYSSVDVSTTVEATTTPLADFNWKGELPAKKRARPNPRAKLSPEEKEEREKKRLADQQQRLLEQRERAAQRQIAYEKVKLEREELAQIKKEMAELTESLNKMRRDRVALSKYNADILPRLKEIQRKQLRLVELLGVLDSRIIAKKAALEMKEKDQPVITTSSPVVTVTDLPDPVKARSQFIGGLNSILPPRVVRPVTNRPQFTRDHFYRPPVTTATVITLE